MAPTPGDEVTITPTPDEGYELGTLTITGPGGKPVPVTDNGDGTYTFTQPGDKVTITATFRCQRGESCPAHHFTDLDLSLWYHDGIHFCVEQELMNGEGGGKFSPNGTLTRAMLCQIFYNKEGRPVVTGSNPFTDVPAGQWYTDAVIWAYENNLVEGYGGGKFGPNDPITREQLAVIIWRYDGKKTSAASLDAFSDAGKVSSYALDALKWAYENKVVSGKGNGILDPLGKATRAEVAQMLMNYLKK